MIRGEGQPRGVAPTVTRSVDGDWQVGEFGRAWVPAYAGKTLLMVGCEGAPTLALSPDGTSAMQACAAGRRGISSALTLTLSRNGVPAVQALAAGYLPYGHMPRGGGTVPSP